MKLSFITRLTLLLIVVPLLFVSCKPGESTSNNDEYDVTSRTNINRVRFTKVGDDENRVEIVLRSRGQMTSSGPQNVLVQGSSGFEHTSGWRGYEEIGFPFTGSVSFDYQKQEHDVTVASQGETESLATTVRASTSFKIETPGRWLVTIYY